MTNINDAPDCGFITLEEARRYLPRHRSDESIRKWLWRCRDRIQRKHGMVYLPDLITELKRIQEEKYAIR